MDGVGLSAQSNTTGAASPTLMPPRIPPQRLVLSLTLLLSSKTNASLFSEPLRMVLSYPAPNSIAFTAGIAKIICEIFPSMPSKIGPPMPAGSPEMTHSMTPPTESQSMRASSILAFIFSAASSEIAGKSFFAHAARSERNFSSLGP